MNYIFVFALISYCACTGGRVIDWFTLWMARDTVQSIHKLSHWPVGNAFDVQLNSKSLKTTTVYESALYCMSLAVTHTKSETETMEKFNKPNIQHSNNVYFSK